jgi:hypothetical protein
MIMTHYPERIVVVPLFPCCPARIGEIVTM